MVGANEGSEMVGEGEKKLIYIFHMEILTTKQLEYFDFIEIHKKLISVESITLLKTKTTNNVLKILKSKKKNKQIWKHIYDKV